MNWFKKRIRRDFVHRLNEIQRRSAVIRLLVFFGGVRNISVDFFISDLSCLLLFMLKPLWVVAQPFDLPHESRSTYASVLYVCVESLVNTTMYEVYKNVCVLINDVTRTSRTGYHISKSTEPSRFITWLFFPSSQKVSFVFEITGNESLTFFRSLFVIDRFTMKQTIDLCNFYWIIAQICILAFSLEYEWHSNGHLVCLSI